MNIAPIKIHFIDFTPKAFPNSLKINYLSAENLNLRVDIIWRC